MMDQITDRDRVEPVIEEVFEVRGKTNEEMLVRTLSEILYLHHAEKLVFKEIELDLKEGGKLTGTIKGRGISRPVQDRHNLHASTQDSTIKWIHKSVRRGNKPRRSIHVTVIS